ncbi:hypothetical protein Neosp_009091 [[Neocosmospora] mangrovei]
MVNTDVIIVGAGPSGLALAIALAARKVKSIVLEKNYEICTDPRAIAMAGDSPRIVNLLGVNRSSLEEMGQVMTCVHFHQNTFTSKPFASIEHDRDWLEQALPPAFVLLQPELEKELRRSIQTSEYAELRLNCTMTGIREVDDGVYATYQREDGETMEIQGKHLVGADGKRGYVRKGYLEAKGIQQLPGLYKYEATWIAANLRITLPTPTSHPSFPLWKLGYQPEQLWDIFWPGGFHLLEGWSRERRKGVDISSIQTARSGNILLSKSACLVGFLKIFSGVLDLLPSVRDGMLRLNFDESDGHRGVDGGFFLEKEGGGFKMAQVCLKTTSGLTQLSDEVFWGRSGVLTLLLLRHPDEEEAVGIKEALDEASLPPYFLSKEVLELCDGSPSDGIELPSYLKANRFFLGTEEDAVRTMAQPLMPHYNPSSFRERFQTATRYALIRPDFIIFSQARSPKELGLQLHAALQMMQQSVKE